MSETPTLSKRARVIRWALVVVTAVIVLVAFPTWATVAVFGALVAVWIGATFLGFVADEYWPKKIHTPREWHGRTVRDPRRWH